jgi:hypothetical protein
MDVSKSLIALGVSIALFGGAWETAVAKKTDEEDSVYRWGRWAVLAPAAGGEEVIAAAPAGTSNLGRCESAANCPDPQDVPPEEPPPEEPPPVEPPPVEPPPVDPPPVEPPPVEPPPVDPPPVEPPLTQVPCAAGQACGFARIDQNGQTSGTSGDRVVPFELSLDDNEGEGEVDTVAFKANPGADDEIASDTEEALYVTDSEGNLVLVRTLDRNAQSILRGAVIVDESGVPVLIQGPWMHAEDGGEYVWGIAATPEQITDLVDRLDGLGELAAIYNGVTANGGTVNMTVDFNAGEWSGDFAGRYSFSATGDVVGSGFASTGFTDPKVSGLVQGGFVNAGNNAIGGYEVDHADLGRDADVFNAVLQNGAGIPR